MKKLIKIVLSLVLIMTIVSANESLVNNAEAANKYYKTNSNYTIGWKKYGNNYSYFNKNGKKAIGWNRINGLWYYFNKSGLMVTGIQQINGSQYFFNSTGVLRNKISSVKKDSNYSQVNNNGKIVYYTKSGTLLGTGKKYISNASAYTGDTTTASGQRPRWGTIAVDPRVIPLGSKVYVPYFDKVFIANDTGGIIRGTMIDIFMKSSYNMNQFGRRNLEIVVLDN